VLPILEESGLKSPADFYLAFSPEREDPGNPSFSTRTIPKVVGGINAESTEVAVALYRAGLDRVVQVSHARVAESTKLLENIFRSINIALVNELKMTFLEMGIDVWEVIAAASTKPFGYMPFYPGPGLGGHCIPLDPFYLSWKAAEHGMWTRFIELAGEINTQMPRFVVSRVAGALNEESKALRGSHVLVLGLSYKANIDDCRESPSFELLEQLVDAGAIVEYCDPYFPEAPHTRKYSFELRSVPCTPEAFARFDALVVATAHDEFKNPELYRNVRLVVDSRNMIAPLVKELRDGKTRLVKA
jgi:UDP-N-acetyl-D-glucosamine dehydrogenase